MKVVPKNDDVRKLLKHPVAGAFRKSGSSEWPNDSFTARRIRDGDVTVSAEGVNMTPAVEEKSKSSKKQHATS